MEDVGRMDPVEQYAHFVTGSHDGFIFVAIGTSKEISRPMKLRSDVTARSYRWIFKEWGRRPFIKERMETSTKTRE